LYTAAAGGLDAYVAQPSKDATAAVLLATDIFGYKTENIRKWADKLADAVRGSRARGGTQPDTQPAWHTECRMHNAAVAWCVM
jgi:hypothetical protein